ncbi:MAG: hypothetical protein AAFZ92_00320 [Pseudomonadota bacterium]
MRKVNPITLFGIVLSTALLTFSPVASADREIHRKQKIVKAHSHHYQKHYKSYRYHHKHPYHKPRHKYQGRRFIYDTYIDRKQYKQHKKHYRQYRRHYHHPRHSPYAGHHHKGHWKDHHRHGYRHKYYRNRPYYYNAREYYFPGYGYIKRDHRYGPGLHLEALIAGVAIGALISHK